MAMFANFQQQHMAAAPTAARGGCSSDPLCQEAMTEASDADTDSEQDEGPPVLEPVDCRAPPVPARKKGGGTKRPAAPPQHQISGDEDESDSEDDLDADIARAMLQGSDPDDNINNQDGADQNEFDAALDQLAEEFGNDDLTGKPVSDKLANIVNRIVRAKLSHDKLKDKLNDDAYRKPANCENLTVPHQALCPIP